MGEGDKAVNAFRPDCAIYGASDTAIVDFPDRSVETPALSFHSAQQYPQERQACRVSRTHPCEPHDGFGRSGPKVQAICNVGFAGAHRSETFFRSWIVAGHGHTTPGKSLTGVQASW
jgi:hypothetical protein